MPNMGGGTYGLNEEECGLIDQYRIAGYVCLSSCPPKSISTSPLYGNHAFNKHGSQGRFQGWTGGTVVWGGSSQGRAIQNTTTTQSSAHTARLSGSSPKERGVVGQTL